VNDAGAVIGLLRALLVLSTVSSFPELTAERSFTSQASNLAALLEKVVLSSATDTVRLRRILLLSRRVPFI
jgi:hypothetical protein